MVQGRFHQPTGIRMGSAEPIMMPRGFTPSAEPMRPPASYYQPAQALPTVYRRSAEPMLPPTTLMAGSAEPYGGPLIPWGGAQPQKPPEGGVGVVFMDQVDQRGLNEVVVKKVYPGSPADRTAKIKAGDVLSDVNGEDVYMRSSKEIHRLIPGKVGTTVILGFRSGDNPAEYYEVECVREMTRLGEMSVDQIARTNQPTSTSADPLAPEEPEFQPIGPQASPGFSLQKSEDEEVFIVANVTPGSSAEQCGFHHGEIMQAIDNVSVESWSERRILKLLTGPYKTLVQVHTNMRVVPVVRDCRSIFDPPRPPPPPMPVMERIVPIERFVVTEKLVPVPQPQPQPQPMMMFAQPAPPPQIMLSQPFMPPPVAVTQPPPMVMGSMPALAQPAPIMVLGPGAPMANSVPPLPQPMHMMQPQPPQGPPMALPSANFYGGPPSPPQTQTAGGFPGVYSTFDPRNDGFL